jgi:hypothetical protein
VEVAASGVTDLSATVFQGGERQEAGVESREARGEGRAGEGKGGRERAGTGGEPLCTMHYAMLISLSPYCSKGCRRAGAGIKGGRTLLTGLPSHWLHSQL